MIPALEPSRGGVERYAFGLGCGLARRGIRVTAFTSARPLARRERPPGFDIEWIPPARGTRSRRERRFEAAVGARLGDAGRWDVVQGFGPTRLQTHHRIGGGSHAAYLRARARYEPGVWSGLARALPAHRSRIARQRALLRTAGLRLLANSDLARRDACADAGLRLEAVPVIHNGVDLDAFQPEADPSRRRRLRRALGLPGEGVTALFLGSGFRRKGLRFALEMLAGARARGAALELLVVGRGREAPYRRQARRLGLESALRFVGPLRDVSPAYAACDVFLLPSLYEPFSNAALEAMACGLPVVVTADSGVAEVVRDGREGRVLARPDAVEDGAAFLARIQAEPELRRSLGARARVTAEGLDLDRHVEQMLRFYESGHGLPATQGGRQMPADAQRGPARESLAGAERRPEPEREQSASARPGDARRPANAGRRAARRSGAKAGARARAISEREARLVRAGVDEAALVPALVHDQGAVPRGHATALLVLGDLGQHALAGPEAPRPSVDEDRSAPGGQLAGGSQDGCGAEPDEAAHGPAIGGPEPWR